MGALDPVAFDAAVRAELELLPAIAECVHRPPAEEGFLRLDPEVLDRLLSAPSLIPWLERTVVSHPGWEDVLRAVRLTLMRRAARADGAAVLPWLVAFAHQSWNNEYAWWGSHEGRTIRAVVEAHATERLVAEPYSDDLAASIAAIAMYTPISTIEGMPEAVDAAWRAGPLASLITRQIDEVQTEESLVDGIPGLGKPAPRSELPGPWPRVLRIPEGAPRPLAAIVEEETGVRVVAAEAPEVLVAGADTGERALARTAVTGARVLAIDPSRHHLAAALRHARVHGLSIEVLQADVVDLALGDRRFHFADAALGGERDPARALEVLTGVLHPGGLVRAVVHAEAHREAHLAARAFIDDRRLPTTRAGLRRARRAILALQPDHPARGLVWRPEFYSLTGFHHALWSDDRRFGREAVIALVAGVGLRLVGSLGDDRDGTWRFWAYKP